MRVLVAGGAGYIGSHVVKALLESGHEPVVYDNLSTGHAQAVPDAELIVGDVSDRESLLRLLRRCSFDGCIHLAASSLVGESMQAPSRYFHNNVGGGLVLFDALIAADVPWVVLSSTAAVYGEPEAVPITEDHPTRPTNPYGESKLMLERILGWYEKAYGLRYTALRYFNAAGAHPDGSIGEDHSPETHLLPLVLQVALGQRDTIAVFGTDYPTPDGTAVRDYVHVCDLADAHLRAMERLHRGETSRIFNLGSQRGYSVLEVIEAARRVTGRSIPVSLQERRAGDPAVLVASAERARIELGWTPQYDLEGIVSGAWRWHESHPAGYRERVGV
jgi:UDP-glucose 4-epimerase